MAKRSTSYELALPLRNPDVPAYQWLYAAMRSEILGGRLRPGTRLPATRDLARQYGLARGTIVNAFDQLASEGYVEGRVGSGTHVSAVLPEELLHVVSGQAAKPAAHGERPLWSQTTVDGQSYLGAMRTGRPALSVRTCQR
jgi:GntR family transcriptional regulator / MocR family aminotransferase